MKYIPFSAWCNSSSHFMKHYMQPRRLERFRKSVETRPYYVETVRDSRFAITEKRYGYAKQVDARLVAVDSKTFTTIVQVPTFIEPKDRAEFAAFASDASFYGSDTDRFGCFRVYQDDGAGLTTFDNYEDDLPGKKVYPGPVSRWHRLNRHNNPLDWECENA